ncbi:T3SS effector NleG family protein [Citrobacter braakii]
MPPVFLTIPVDDRGRLQHVPQGAVTSLHDEARNNPGGITVRLGASEYRITYGQELPDFFSVNNTGNQGEQPVWLRDALQSTNGRTLERQLNNGRTATEVMEEQLDRLLHSRVSTGVQGLLGKIDACLFVTELAGFQISGEHLTCPVTLSIPEQASLPERHCSQISVVYMTQRH